MGPADHESWSRWLDLLLPDGGHVVLLIETYFDESGTDDLSPLMSVAGYIFEKKKAVAFSQEWNAILQWSELPHPLPYFHMSECAPDPGFGHFADLTKPQRIEVSRRCHEAIKKYAVQGLVVTTCRAEYDAIMPKNRYIGSAYTACVNTVLAGIDTWANNSPDVARISYVFEAGHDSASESNRIMTDLFRLQIAGPKRRNGGHAFLPKEGNPGLQAADILAWHACKDVRNKTEGRKRRKDFESLLELHHTVVHMCSARCEDSFTARMGGR